MLSSPDCRVFRGEITNLAGALTDLKIERDEMVESLREMWLYVVIILKNSTPVKSKSDIQDMRM